MDPPDGPNLLTGGQPGGNGLLLLGAVSLRPDDEQPENGDHQPEKDQ
jgi:hypothetical protein